MSQNIQYRLESFEPDLIGNFNFTVNANSATRILIPCRPTICDWVQVNQYNLDVTGTPTTINGAHPKPAGNIRIGTYRAIYPTSPLPVTAINVGELIKTSTHLTAVPVVTTLNKAQMDGNPKFLGGCFWIVIQLENTAVSGSNTMVYTISGITSADANLTHQVFEGTATLGALPTNITGDTLTALDDCPYIRADFI